MNLRGRVVDYGDLIYHEEWLVKGRRLRLRVRVGVPRDALPADRATLGTVNPSTGEADVAVDLQADKKVTLSVEWQDEVGNPTTTPADATVTYTVDDATVINLTDNSDGTAVAAATGTLGQATVHVEGSAPGVLNATGDLLLVVVAGDAQRLEVVAGEPEEITPDA